MAGQEQPVATDDVVIVAAATENSKSDDAKPEDYPHAVHDPDLIDDDSWHADELHSHGKEDDLASGSFHADDDYVVVDGGKKSDKKSDKKYDHVETKSDSLHLDL